MTTTIPILKLNIGPDGRVIAVAPGAAAGQLPLSPAIVGRLVSEVLPAELSEFVLAAARDEAPAERWHALEARASRDPATKGAEIVLAVRDLSDEKRIKEALHVSEERHRVLADSARDVVWTMSPDGRMTYISPAIEKVRGYTPAEAMAQPMDEIFPPESLARSVGYFTQMLATLQAGGVPAPFRGDLEYNCKDGTTFWTEVLAFPVLDANGGLVELLGVTRDLTDRRNLEAEARSEQRMASMERMAAGVAHEANNAMAIVRTAAELLVHEVAGSLAATQLQANILESVDRVGALTAHLLSFSRRQQVSPVDARMGDLVEGARVLLERLASPSATVTVVMAEGAADAVLRADRDQFCQVLRHLVANGRDAMAAGGRMEIRCATTELRAPLATRTGRLAPGAYATLVVEDGGSGMAPSVLEHIFDPFFTTKRQDQGSGLGLPTVFGILKQNAAGLTVESESGKGSRFTVLWPMRATALATQVPVAAKSRVDGRVAGRDGGACTVLVVDDEPALLRLMGRAIERSGYRPVLAAGGAEALAIVRAQEQVIDAIVTDVRMPGMSGPELIDTLADEEVDVPVLFVSGQIDAAIAIDSPATARRMFLAKPFEIRQLVRALGALGIGAERVAS